jgi:membrane protein
MLGNIERTFNKIWGVGQGRFGLNKLLLYWAVLSIGPLLLGSAFALSTYVASLKYWSIGTTIIPSPFIALYPALITAATFSLLFIAVPNCNVPIKYGLIGGSIAACAFEILKFLFALVVANTNFTFIYGAFAALPLFLIWLNLVWMIVLGGAVLVRILAQKRYLVGRDGHSDFSAALACLALLRQGQLNGRPLDEFSFALGGINQHHWQKLRDKWCSASWLSKTALGQFVLCRDLASCTLWELAEVIDLRFTDVNKAMSLLPQFPALEHYIKPIMSNHKEAWGVSILTLIDPEFRSNEKLSIS